MSFSIIVRIDTCLLLSIGETIFPMNCDKSNAPTEFSCVQYTRPDRSSALDKYQFQGKCLHLSHFLRPSKCKIYSPYSNTTEKQNHLLMLEKLSIASLMPLKMKSINNIASEKHDQSTFTRSTTHQKHHAKSGRSTWSALDIFYTFLVLTNSEYRKF